MALLQGRVDLANLAMVLVLASALATLWLPVGASFANHGAVGAGLLSSPVAEGTAKLAEQRLSRMDLAMSTDGSGSAVHQEMHSPAQARQAALRLDGAQWTSDGQVRAPTGCCGNTRR